MTKKHSHSITVLITVLIANYFSLGLYTAIIISTWYIAREHTQAEYRTIKQHYNGKRSNMPFYGGFLPRAWNYDSLVNDATLPTIVAFLTYGIGLIYG